MNLEGQEDQEGPGAPGGPVWCQVILNFQCDIIRKEHGGLAPPANSVVQPGSPSLTSDLLVPLLYHKKQTCCEEVFHEGAPLSSGLSQLWAWLQPRPLTTPCDLVTAVIVSSTVNSTVAPHGGGSVSHQDFLVTHQGV